MSNMRDGPVLKAVADVVKEHVGKAFVALRARLEELDSRFERIETELTIKALGPPISDVIDRHVIEVDGKINALEATIKALPRPERGEQGETGPAGMVGPSGKDGRDGIDGKNGVDGISGKDGANGIDGAKGMDGAAGKDGEDGIDGKNGVDGSQGIQGEKGIDGEPGKDGEKGLDGKDGLPGVKGLDGTDGRDGSDGKDAPPIDAKAFSDEITQKVLGQIPAPIHGKDGRDGRDAEQLDVNDIVSKILGQIPPPIPGKDGADGLSIKGDPGLAGKDAPEVDTEALSAAIFEKVLGAIPEPKPGLDGKDGASVDPESVRILVTAEVIKAVSALPKPAAGRDGRDGRAGDIGPAGRDVLDFDILDGIDEMASYQRGTFAHHRGGLLKAYRTTDPVHDKDFAAAGWQVISEGLADAGSALSADERTVVTSLELTSGKLLTSKFEIPTLIHKGAWKSDQEYRRGDFATMAGSTWHCNEFTTERPGTSKAWTLVVKRGSDGKDAPLHGTHLNG